MDKYEAADLLVAAYAHACGWHGGQWSPLYERLCTVGKVFKPGPCWRGIESEDEGSCARGWYDQLICAHDGTGWDLPLEKEVAEALAIIETAEF